MRSKTAVAIFLTVSSLPLLAAEGPALGVGSAAPALQLPAAGGGTKSLAAADGTTVLIFFRGLW